jgi:hypothetical protein
MVRSSDRDIASGPSVRRQASKATRARVVASKTSRRSVLAQAVPVLACGIPSVLDAQALPTGSEFQVNSYTRFNQMYPVVAAGGGGDFVVVW